MKVWNYHEDYEKDDDEKECPICQCIYSVPLKQMVRCKKCGAYFESKDKWEYWDQSNPDYTDERLEWFARDATEWLLKEEWEKEGWDYKGVDIIVHPNKLERGWGKISPIFWEDDPKSTMAIINYSLPTLRNKKQCLHNVAHETAHAVPAVIVEWYGINEMAKKYALPNCYLNGHFPTWQDKLWEFVEKLKQKYPKYYYQ